MARCHSPRSAAVASPREAVAWSARARALPQLVHLDTLPRDDRRARVRGGAAARVFAPDQRGAARASRSWWSTPWTRCTTTSDIVDDDGLAPLVRKQQCRALMKAPVGVPFFRETRSVVLPALALARRALRKWQRPRRTFAESGRDGDRVSNWRRRGAACWLAGSRALTTFEPAVLSARLPFFEVRAIGYEQGSRHTGGSAALVAECRAGPAACKNARLPMQSRLGRSGSKGPPVTPAA